MTETTDRAKTSTLVRLAVVLVFIFVLALGMWGSIQIARAIPNAFSNLAAAVVGLTSIFVPANETITLSAPSLAVDSGETFLLSWVHKNKGTDGTYTFRYSCADGVSFTSPNAAGTETTVFCNTPFNFLNANNAIILNATSNKAKVASVQLFVDFTPSAASQATVSGSLTITITNNTVSTSTTEPQTPVITTPTHVTPTAGSESNNTFPIGTTGGAAASNPNGFVDLTGRVIEVGIVNKTTGQFTASSTPMRNPPGARLAVRFAVQNDGTKTSPQFDFSAVLPTFPSHIFTSPMQQELAPGDRIEFTLAFDGFIDADSGVFTLNVDPSSRIMEPNKGNNIIHYTVYVVR